jgi:signal peptidase II
MPNPSHNGDVSHIPTPHFFQKPSWARLTFFLLAAIIFLADQASKWWILLKIMQPVREIAVTPFFNLVLAYNRGISFSLLHSEEETGRWLLIMATSLIIIGLVIWAWRQYYWRDIVALGLIVGGACGNLFDRFWHGAVVDFLDFHWHAWHWPAFNLADSAIFCGVVLLLLTSLFPPAPTNPGA